MEEQDPGLNSGIFSMTFFPQFPWSSLVYTKAPIVRSLHEKPGEYPEHPQLPSNVVGYADAYMKLRSSYIFCQTGSVVTWGYPPDSTPALTFETTRHRLLTTEDSTNYLFGQAISLPLLLRQTEWRGVLMRHHFP